MQETISAASAYGGIGQSMCPEEFKACRASLGYTQAEMAKALRLYKHGNQAIGMWESGRADIPGPVSLAVEYLLYLQASGEPLPEAYLLHKGKDRSAAE